MSSISKNSLTKEQKIEISLKVFFCVLIFAVAITIAVVCCVNLKNKSRLRQIQVGTFYGELTVRDNNGELPEKQKIKFLVTEITREEYLQSDGIGTVKDIVAEDLRKNKYYRFELFLEEDGGGYVQVVLGKMAFDRHRNYYYYEDEGRYIRIEPYTADGKSFAVTIITQKEEMQGDLYKGE